MDSFNAQLFAEILSFLPLAVVTRLKTVCKAWKQLISDPYFRARRLSRRQQVVGFYRSTLCSHNIDTDRGLLFHIPLPLPCTDEYYSRGRRTTMMCSLDGHTHLSVLAVCDGLLFVAADKCAYYVWNPSNKSFTRIPPPPMEELTHFGLAKDSSSSSCSVVVGLNYRKHICFVYSRRRTSTVAAAAGTWTQLNIQQRLSRPEEHYTAVGAACARRSLHWLTRSGGILALDIGSGQFREMDPPRHGVRVKVGSRDGNVLLRSVDDDLYFLLADADSSGSGATVELWVLENYDEVRWKRVMELGSGHCSSSRVLPVYFDGRRIAILKEDERTISFYNYDASNTKWEGDYHLGCYSYGFFPFIKDATVLEEEGGEGA